MDGSTVASPGQQQEVVGQVDAKLGRAIPQAKEFKALFKKDQQTCDQSHHGLVKFRV